MMDDRDRGNRLIFVGGAPRSGTTLVQNMLDCHPDIFGGPEFDHIPSIAALRKALIGSIESGRIDVFCTKADVDDAIGAFIERLLLPLADKNGCRFLSEKSPMNVVAFGDLLDLFPSARFFHVVRDPRATVSSLMQVAIRARARNFPQSPYTKNLGAAVQTVKQCDAAGFHAAAVAPDRVMALVYEKLVTDPENATKVVCSFLGVEWNAEMLHPGRKQHAGEKALDGVWYDRASYYRDPVTDEIDKWKRLLPAEHQAFVTQAFKDDVNYKKLGYDFLL